MRLTALTFILASALQAGHPLVTEDGGTQGFRGLQIELSAENSDHHQPGQVGRAQDGSAGLTLGLAERVDLNLALPVTRIWSRNEAGEAEAQGLGDAQVALKWMPFRAGAWSLGLKPALSVPSGDKGRGLGAEQEGYELRLIQSLDFDAGALHLNAAYAPQPRAEAGQRSGLWSATAAASAGLGPWTLALEGGLSQASDEAQTAFPVFGTLGFIYAHTPRLDMDAGFRYSAEGDAFERRWMAGMTFRP